jgi:hypothetical protein
MVQNHLDGEPLAQPDLAVKLQAQPQQLPVRRSPHQARRHVADHRQGFPM